ncbi:putative nuclear cap binding complex subunit CBP30 [Trypanosoma theileri]|uniref:Putative nuclear cap binding complex subunit CBP30 n=1 Tax=Trypanosoma theileri TaxID=67003 RepID=A0A1X0P6J9_9TRYP|nr:putative nuclear cap binding complex subunit CBP30 [Trypanosoma theileri]ORC92485.1 putative nuclear cap binding complex subunit CBP30 [Trypanosoma theileri]
MGKGSGFVHLNTPAAISYSPGQQVTLSDLRQARSREECVVLPRTVAIWRTAFRAYVRAKGLSQFVGDVEAERDGEGPILPPLREATSTAQKRQLPQSVSNRSTLDSTNTNTTTNTNTNAETAAITSGSTSQRIEKSSSSSEAPGIKIVSHHKLSGERVFVYPDHDGVLSAGVVPQVVISAEEKAEREADQKYYISPQEMSEEDRAALEELQELWKSRARSRSIQGASHRAAAGNLLPDGDAINVEDEKSGEAHVKRNRLESHTENVSSRSTIHTDDALDDALRLAGEFLDHL